MIPVFLPLVCMLPSFPYRTGTDRISAILWLQPDSCWLVSNPPVYQWGPLVQGLCCQAVHADKCPPTTCILCVNTKNSTLGRKTNKGSLNLSFFFLFFFFFSFGCTAQQQNFGIEPGPGSESAKS